MTNNTSAAAEGVGVGRYRKKPVIIEAIQWTGNNTAAIYEFVFGKLPDTSGRAASERWEDYCAHALEHGFTIPTLEDGEDGRAKHVASLWDWVIRGVQGEHYPCKPDIFAATYEPTRGAS